MAVTAIPADRTEIAPIRRALLSVSDKAGLEALAAALAARGVELLSTGGSAAALRAAGIAVRDVGEVTGFPEVMDGRVKTLHPAVHGGLLAVRSNAAHRGALEAHGIPQIDLLVVNLYPFEETMALGADPATVIENIDIGGPAMIRAAAKNHNDVTVIVDPDDYTALLAELDRTGGGTSRGFRGRMALTAFSRTAAYDAAVSGWMRGQVHTEAPMRRLTVAGTLRQTLRYGENPHQGGLFYADGTGRPGVATARQVQGKELSYNNINDTDAAVELVAEFDAARPACVIVKHANPCGVALGDTLEEAYRRAFDCDRTSAFGGIVALNRALDGATAERIAAIFTEVVIAPGADEDALRVFSSKKNLRLLLLDALPDPARPGTAWRQVAGGFLVQDRDAGRIGRADLTLATTAAPSEAQLDDLIFAWRVAKHVKSNAIVYARDGRTVGIGAGQMSRLDSAIIAARKAERMAEALGLHESPVRGAAVASDAFFPFADGLMEAVAAGATSVIQPGGSMRDAEVIAAADANGIAMVLTGMRHFRH